MKLQLHCRGLDQDLNQHYATLTAIVQFSPSSHICRNLLDFYECRVKLTVEVFDGRVEQGCKISTAVNERKLTSDEREHHTMHITVNKVIDLDKIVYTETCPDLITLRITANLEANRLHVYASNVELDSGCGDHSIYVDVSTSTTERT